MVRTVASMLVVLALSACGGSKAQAPTALAPLPVTPLVEKLIDTIISDSFVVPARNFKPFEIAVAPGMSNPRLEGTFTASGANHDIEVLLLDEQQFSNWLNRHEFRSVYASGRVTADKLRIDLPEDPGKYFVIFSNRFSILSSKGVVADLKLRYDRSR